MPFCLYSPQPPIRIARFRVGPARGAKVAVPACVRSPIALLRKRAGALNQATRRTKARSQTKAECMDSACNVLEHTKRRRSRRTSVGAIFLCGHATFRRSSEHARTCRARPRGRSRWHQLTRWIAWVAGWTAVRHDHRCDAYVTRRVSHGARPIHVASIAMQVDAT